MIYFIIFEHIFQAHRFFPEWESDLRSENAEDADEIESKNQ